MEGKWFVNYFSITVIISVIQITDSVNITGSGRYLIPNVLYNLTCTYDNVIPARSTLYQVMHEGTSLKQFFMQYQTVNQGCYYVVQATAKNCTADLCSCDLDGSATQFRYNHTSNLKGELSFTCNSAGSDTITISVAEGPGNSTMLTPNKLSVVKIAGDSLGPIECLATCFPQCNYQWILPNGTDTAGNRLEIQYLSKDDDGIYKCRAWNEIDNIGKTKNLILTVNYGPENVLLNPSTINHIVTENGTVGPVICSAACRPSCTYKWTGPFVPSDTTYNLTLSPVNRNQNGNFYCSAINPDTNVTADSIGVNVDVQFGPGNSLSFYPDVQTITKTKGEQLGPINCSATCSPNCNYKWTKGNIVFDKNQLLIFPLLLIHHGKFTCTAWNGIGEAQTKDLDVTINYGPDSVELSPLQTDFSVTENETIGPVLCSAECRPSCTYHWFGPNFSAYTTNLSIARVNRSQKGTFNCTVSNTDTKATNRSPNIFIDVQYGPGNSMSFNPDVKTITQIVGKQLGPINCSATCNPDCHYKWTTGNTVFNERTLFIPKLSLSHHGIFTCTAWNGIDNGNVKPLDVIIHYGPSTVSLWPPNTGYTVKEDGNISTITCFAACRPPCAYKWSGPNFSTGTTQNLTLIRLNRNQTGTFYCTASNQIINATAISSNINIDVQYIAFVTDLRINSTNNTVPENTTVEFLCMYEGNPIPNITWLFNGNDLIRQEGIANKSRFFVASAKCQNIGNYTCVSENNIGNSSKVHPLYVSCTPRSIKELKHAIAIKNKTDALNLTVDFVSYPQPTKIRWFFGKNMTSSMDPVDNILIYNTLRIYRHVSELRRTVLADEDYGYYRIEINNGIGNSFNHIFQVLPETVPDMPYNVSAMCDDTPSTTSITWKAGFHGGQTQVFEIWFKKYGNNVDLFVKYPETKADPGRDKFESVNVLNLISATPYVFYVNASNINGHSLSRYVYCNTTSASHRAESNSIVIGAAAGATSAIVVLIVIIVALVLYRKLHKDSDTKDKRFLTGKERDCLDELPDNPDYISADLVTHNVDNKDKTIQRKIGEKQQHIDVSLQEPEPFKSNDTLAEYAVVVKTTRKDEKNDKEQKKKPMKKRGKKDSERLELGEMYINTGKLNKKDMNDEVYANAGERNVDISEKRKKNKDGLVYADLDLVQTPKGNKFIIRGLENRNNYAIIDLNKHAEPLPSDDETEQENDNDHGGNKIEVKG